MRQYETTSTSTPDDPRAAQLGTPGKTTLTEQINRQGAGAPSASRPTLRVGSTGPAVAELQQKLGVAADGQFGPKTRAAVIAFQQGHALGADGVVGPQTWTALEGGARAAIVAAARSKIGTVFSDVAGEADATGDKTRMGWQTLTEIFDVGYPSFPRNIIKYIKHGKNNGKPGSSSNGLVSWCGIFATWAVITGGGTCGTWEGGSRCSSMSKITRDPRPGDVGYFTANAHHCIIASVNGDQIETIDGNSYDGSSGGNGAITSRMRSRHDFAGFFKQVDD